MSYTPTTWTTGDTITAEKLNHLEGGVEAADGGALIVTQSDTESHYVLDKTWKEIHDAFVAGIPVIINEHDESQYGTNDYSFFVTEVFCNVAVDPDPSYWCVDVVHQGSRREYQADSETGYPSYYYGD